MRPHATPLLLTQPAGALVISPDERFLYGVTRSYKLGVPNQLVVFPEGGAAAVSAPIQVGAPLPRNQRGMEVALTWTLADPTSDVPHLTQRAAGQCS